MRRSSRSRQPRSPKSAMWAATSTPSSAISPRRRSSRHASRKRARFAIALQTRESEARKVRHRAADAAEERVLDALLPPAREVNFEDMQPTDSAARQKFRKMLREGKLDDKEVEVELA